MKKFCVLFIVLGLFYNNSVLATEYILQTQKYTFTQNDFSFEEDTDKEELPPEEKNNENINELNNIDDSNILNIEASFYKTPFSEYKQKTVNKHYDVYNISITNKSKKPILLTSDTEVSFVLSNGSIIKSKNRRTIYRNSRKKDIGRYYTFALPGAIIAGGITGMTFFLGSPIAAGVYAGMYLPTDKATRTNVKISQDIFNTNSVPIKFEQDKTYNMHIYAPKGSKIKEIVFSNASFDLKEMFELRVKEQNL